MPAPASSNKIIVDSSSYAFSAGAKRITLLGGYAHIGLQLKNFLLITNVQSGTNQVIYQFNKVGFGGTFADPDLTLDFDTTGMSDSDELMIIMQSEFFANNVIVSGSVTTNLAEYQEDSPHSSTERGTFVLAVRNDTLINLTDNDGDYSPIAVDSKGRIAITAGGATLPISGTVAIDQSVAGTTDSVTVKASVGIGSLTETAPVTDTASSGLNGRLQRIAQRITSLITALGSPFQAGGSIGNTTFGSTIIDGGNVNQGANADAAVVTDTSGTLSGKLRGLVKWAFERMPASLGQKAMTASLPVTIASDQSAVPVSGTVAIGAGSAVIGHVITDSGSITAATIADAANVVEGAIADAIVAAGATGTISAKLRRATQGLEDLKTLITVLPLPTGAATSSNQTTEIASLASIDAGIPAALGQTTMSASMPVALSSDQVATIPPGTNSRNAYSLAITDVSQFEGQTTAEIMVQILKELKINNEYMYELPLVLQRLLDDTTKPAWGFGVEPTELRNDPNFV